MRLPTFFPGQHHIVLGRTHWPLPRPLLALSPQEQSYHAAVWGRTGSGKSKLLQSLFLQHLRNGTGVAIVEPHHDLSIETLARLVSDGFFRRESAFDRLIYIDWGNGAYLPFNVLAAPGDPHTIALNSLEAMIRVWPELRQAPTFQTLFLSAVVTLVANRLPLTSLYQLLSDGQFRGSCLARVADPLIHQSFASFEKIKDQVQEAGSALRRAFLVSFHPAARLTLGQADNWLNFRTIMDSGTCLIINLGNIDDAETRRLLGALLLVQIEQAALSRTNLAPADRRPYTVLIDEWPSFAAQDDTIGTILSQTRKFNLRLYLAAQSTAQISSGRLLGALENCKLNILFGLGRQSAAFQAQHITDVSPYSLKEAPLTETQHGQYLSVLEQFETTTQELMHLPQQFAFVKVHDQSAVKVKTLSVPPAAPDPQELTRVLLTYKRRYQRSTQEAEAASGHLVAPSVPVTKPLITLFPAPSNEKDQFN